LLSEDGGKAREIGLPGSNLQMVWRRDKEGPKERIGVRQSGQKTKKKTKEQQDDSYGQKNKIPIVVCFEIKQPPPATEKKKTGKNNGPEAAK